MDFGKSYWVNYLSEIGLSELPLQEVHLANIDYSEIPDLYLEAASVYSEFLKYIEKHCLDELIRASFKKTDLDMMMNGVCPYNASIVLKIPLEYGGSIELDNMYLIRKNPFEFAINDFFLKQIKAFNNDISNNSFDVKLPDVFYAICPKGNVFYPSVGSLAISGGPSFGKADQLASQIEQSKQKELKAIALLKSMGGKSK